MLRSISTEILEQAPETPNRCFDALDRAAAILCVSGGGTPPGAHWLRPVALGMHHLAALTLFVSLCAVAHKVAPRTPEGYLYVVGFRSQV